MNFKKNILLYTILPLLLLAISASYFRFMVTHDYLVMYEGECDPYVSVCFEYCEDEDCIDPFYYTEVVRSASQIHANCTNDITSCDFAYTDCGSDETECKISYCDMYSETGRCETREETDRLPDENTPTLDPNQTAL
jgi:hypothetical protein